MISMNHLVPEDKKQWRACLLCSVILTANQFRMYGCPNCEELLRMRGSAERAFECTTTNYEGFIALIQPETGSWVAKWQGLDKFQPGLYAVRVTGSPPGDVLDELEQRGIPFKQRDGSSN